MDCRNCKRTDAYHVRTSVENGEFLDSCNFCGGFYSAGLEFADVYFPGPHVSENITDDRGVPIRLESRAHKARLMRERGMTEAGDRIRGSYDLPKPSGRSWYEQRRNQGKIR